MKFQTSAAVGSLSIWVTKLRTIAGSKVPVLGFVKVVRITGEMNEPSTMSI